MMPKIAKNVDLNLFMFPMPFLYLPGFKKANKFNKNSEFGKKILLLVVLQRHLKVNEAFVFKSVDLNLPLQLSGSEGGHDTSGSSVKTLAKLSETWFSHLLNRTNDKACLLTEIRPSLKTSWTSTADSE